MSGRKKILAYSVKLGVGALCFWIIWSRMQVHAGSTALVMTTLSEKSSIILVAMACLLMPLNWGIESYKWRLVTGPIEAISFSKAFQSVLAGVCVGNLAPGRSTEFVAKILFFSPGNRAMVTLLHFVNGMFQLLITVAMGIFGLLLSFSSSAAQHGVIYLVFALALLLLSLFILIVARFEWLQQRLFALKWLQKYKPAHTVSLSRRQISLLLSASALRYAVFTLQFYLLLLCFHISIGGAAVLCGIAVYFMLTSVIPMISIVEPAIRAAIALFVFNADASWSYQLIAVSTMLWLINIVLPSIIGYVIILKEKFIIQRKEG